MLFKFFCWHQFMYKDAKTMICIHCGKKKNRIVKIIENDDWPFYSMYF